MPRLTSRRRGRRRLTGLPAVALLLCAGCSAASPPGGTTPTAASRPAPAAARSPSIAAAPPGAHVAWRARLDGAVYGSPLVVAGIVIAATEDDTVVALAATTGRPLWSRHLGSPVPANELACGDIDPVGVTGTPAYDPVTRSVFVAAELAAPAGPEHMLVALDARTGVQRWDRSLDPPGSTPAAQLQRGALAVSRGRVYVPLGGLYGDCGPYHGYLDALSTSGRGRLAVYQVPSSREGGLWAPPGPTVAPDGSLFVSVGNGASTSAYDGSDSVLHLSADLRLLSSFAPANWAADNAADLDLGSTGPLLLPDGRVVIAGKRGTVYLLPAGNLGGIGGELASVTGCVSFGAAVAQAGVAYLPCAHGVRALAVGRPLRWHWQAPSSVRGSPVLAGGQVWALDRADGRLDGLDPGSGAVRVSVPVGPVSRFAVPAVAGDELVVPVLSGVVSVVMQ